MNAISQSEVQATIPAIGEIWSGEGGIYCGILPAVGDRPAQHMIFSAVDIGVHAWGGYGSLVPGAESRHDGRANTTALLESIHKGAEHPAAKAASEYTADGKADFHLPSQLELFLASIYVPELFEKALHWTSTQRSANLAFVQDFEYGYSYWASKVFGWLVRPVRWIQVL